MKLIIDIVDDDYNRINSYSDGKTFYPITARLYKAVKDGTPLDEIRAELMLIEGMEDAIEIIDKYRNEVGE